MNRAHARQIINDQYMNRVLWVPDQCRVTLNSDHVSSIYDRVCRASRVFRFFFGGGPETAAWVSRIEHRHASDPAREAEAAAVVDDAAEGEGPPVPSLAGVWSESCGYHQGFRRTSAKSRVSAG